MQRIAEPTRVIRPTLPPPARPTPFDRLDARQDLYYIPSNVQCGGRRSYITRTGPPEFTDVRLHASAVVLSPDAS